MMPGVGELGQANDAIGLHLIRLVRPMQKNSMDCNPPHTLTCMHFGLHDGAKCWFNAVAKKMFD